MKHDSVCIVCWRVSSLNLRLGAVHADMAHARDSGHGFRVVAIWKGSQPSCVSMLLTKAIHGERVRQSGTLQEAADNRQALHKKTSSMGVGHGAAGCGCHVRRPGNGCRLRPVSKPAGLWDRRVIDFFLCRRSGPEDADRAVEALRQGLTLSTTWQLGGLLDRFLSFLPSCMLRASKTNSCLVQFRQGITLNIRGAALLHF